MLDALIVEQRTLFLEDRTSLNVPFDQILEHVEQPQKNHQAETQ